MKKMNVEKLTLKEYLDSETSSFLEKQLRDELMGVSDRFNFKLMISSNELGIDYSQDLKTFFIELDHRYQKLVHSFKFTSRFDELLARSLGHKRGNKNFNVLDSTAGFLGDSLLMRAMGMNVVGVERNPIVALQILHCLNYSSSAFKENFKFYWMEAEHLLSQVNASSFDAILFDPMYSHPSSKTKPKKEMQILRQLIGDKDSGEESAKILKKNCKRLVIKRPVKARPLLDKPDLSFKGKSTRYDVYLKN